MILSVLPDLLGVYFFAVSGSLLAARKEFDLIGSALLASLVGLGGGVVRDLIIGAGVPDSFTNPIYLIPVALAVISVYFASAPFLRRNNWLFLADAAGLALFCITGTAKALLFGLHPVSAVLLGLTTAVGGGLLRDITANETPRLFNHRDIYATPALIGAIITALLWWLGLFSVWTALATAVLIFSLRILFRRLNWHFPLAVRQRSAIKALKVRSKRG